LSGAWVPQGVRDALIDYVNRWADRSDLPTHRFVNWLGIAPSKFYNWRARYGKINEHNGHIPRDWWLFDWEKKAIVDFHSQHPFESYRRLAFMMLDADVVAASPSSVYRVLRDAGLMQKHNCKPSLKVKGFQKPSGPHEDWHVDVSDISIDGTFFSLLSLLDGCSRFIVHWEISQSLSETDIETIIQRARERYPDARPRIISENSPQFIAKDFKEFIELCGMTHVRTSPYYRQSTGKTGRRQRSLESECILPGVPLSLEDAQQLLGNYVRHYNEVHLHSALGYVTPADKLAARDRTIFAERDRKLETARQQRRKAREATPQAG
jgi:putative transposase